MSRARRSFPLAGCSFLVLVAVPGAPAQSDPTLAPRLERLRKAAQDDPAISPELKSALADLADALEQQQPPPRSDAADALARAFGRIRFHGDFRLRHETDWHLDDLESRNRERVRLRLGAEYDVNDQIAVGARLVTGTLTDENSPHQNLGGTLDKFTISLDRAYATWKPPSLPGAWLTAGKFAHAFEINPVYAEIVWDSDIQPTGVAAGWKRAGVPLLGDVGLVAGEYLLLDNATSGTLESAAAFVVQASARQECFGAIRCTEAIGVYRYQELNPDDVNAGRLFSENAGNAGVDTTGDGIPDDYASRFTTWNPFFAMEAFTLSVPVTVAAEYVLNPRAQGDADQGYALGVRFGTTRKRGDWQAYYQWQVMEQDAVLSNFTNDDFLFATNYRGHLFGLRYQLLEKTEAHVWGSCMRRDELGTTPTSDSDQYQWRARVDLNIRF